MQKIVGVKRFGDKNIYHFLDNFNTKIGDKVVIEVEEFLTVATVVRDSIKTADEKLEKVEKIIRIATANDIKKYDELLLKAKSQLPTIKKKSLELGLMMKFVSAEYSLDNSKIIIVFSSEERVDFRQLLKELASLLKVRIELKQIGQRDEIMVCGGVGPCGQPCCCARFLNDFEHVTVKMAKLQGLSLSPTKINGVCGRLMCCLGYEASNYEEVLAKMPKINTEVTTPNGKGVVVYNDILRERVSVKRQAEGDTFVVEDFALEEINNTNAKAKQEKEIKTEAENEIEDPKVEDKKVVNEIKNKPSNSKYGMEIVDAASEGNNNDKNNKKHFKKNNHRRFNKNQKNTAAVK